MSKSDGRTLPPGLDVIILAGGRGTRMDGVDKASVVVNGQRLIDILLDELSMLSNLMQVTVVTTRGLDVRPGVKVAQEDPPFAGPAAAIGAGVASLRSEASSRTAILAVDAPESAALLDDLTDALAENPTAGAALIRAEDGRLQPLCSVWRTSHLHVSIDRLTTSEEGLANLPVRSLIENIKYVEVAGTGEERDYDTFEELAEYGDVEEM